jgi:hypothetical protein
MESPHQRPTSATLRRFAAALAHLAALHLVTACGASPQEARSPGMAEGPSAPPAPMAQQAPEAAAAPASPFPAGAAPSIAAPKDTGVDAMYDAVPSSAPSPPSSPSQPGSAAKAPAQRPPTPSKAPPPTKTATAAKAAPDKGGDRPAASGERHAGPSAPLLIYVGDLAMLVVEQAELPKTIDSIIDTAESLGGYLAGRKDTSVQVRVPSSRFRESLQLLEKLGEITHRSVTADDVSEQYSDLEVRLANLKATQKRLHEFLAKTGTIADMLVVGQQLERVSGEIEAIEGKMRFLRSRAAFSVVTVNLSVKPKPVAVIAKSDPLPPPPPPPREIALPINWLPRVGLDTLLNLH